MATCHRWFGIKHCVNLWWLIIDWTFSTNVSEIWIWIQQIFIHENACEIWDTRIFNILTIRVQLFHDINSIFLHNSFKLVLVWFPVILYQVPMLVWFEIDHFSTQDWQVDKSNANWDPFYHVRKRGPCWCSFGTWSYDQIITTRLHTKGSFSNIVQLWLGHGWLVTSIISYVLQITHPRPNCNSGLNKQLLKLRDW